MSLLYLLQTLITLNLENNQIGAEGARSIAQGLQINQVTYIFSIFASITSFLYSLQTLTTLNLVDNEIGDAGAQSIAQALQINQVRYRFTFFTSISNLFFL